MTKRKKFTRIYCPECKMDTKHERIEDAFPKASSRYFGLDGWKCKKCGKVIAEPNDPQRKESSFNLYT